MPHLYPKKKKKEDASLTTSSNKLKTKTLHSLFPTTLVIIHEFFMVQNLDMFHLNITNLNVYSYHII